LSPYLKRLAYLINGAIIEVILRPRCAAPSMWSGGKAPLLRAAEDRQPVVQFESNTLIGLRGRALTGAIIHSFARFGAALAMIGGDLFRHREQLWLRPHE
jgi:hypothetical protein